MLFVIITLLYRHSFLHMHSCMVPDLLVGNLVVCLGVAMGAGLAQGSTSTSEPLWRGLGAVPWADHRTGTNELIGEDPPVIIRLGANQLMS